MKTVHTYLLIIFPIITLFLPQKVAFASVISDSDLARLETLLINRDFTSVRNYFQMKMSAMNSQQILEEEFSEFDEIKSSFESCMKNIENIINANDELCDTLVVQNLRLNKQFQQHNAGQDAAEYYREFKRLVSIGEIREALRHYYIAKYYKVKHHRINFVTHMAYYKKAREEFERRNYKEAAALLALVQDEKQHNPRLQKYHEEIELLVLQTNKRKRSVELQSRVESSIKMPQKYWIIYIGLGFYTHGEIDAFVWQRTRSDKSSDVSISLPIDKVYGPVGFGASGGFEYHVRDNVRIGAKMDYATYKYNKLQYKSWDCNISYDTNVLYADVYFQFLFSTLKSFRTFCGLGYGLTHAVREELDYTNIPITSEGQISFPSLQNSIYNVIEKSDLTSHHIVPQFGFEYIIKSKVTLIPRFTFMLYYNMKESDILPNLNYSFSFHFGVLL